MLGWAPERGWDQSISPNICQKGGRWRRNPSTMDRSRTLLVKNGNIGRNLGGLLILGWQQEMECCFPGNLSSCSKKFHVFYPFPNLPPKLNQNGTWSIPSQEVKQKSPIGSEDPEGDQVEMFDPFFSIFLPISKLSQIEDLPMSPLLADKSAHFPGRHPHLYHPPLLHSCHEENIKRKG